MSWVIVMLLAAAAFALAAFMLRHRRQTWTLFAAALCFGLAGYGWHARPDIAAAPTQASVPSAANGAQMIEARTAFMRPERLLSRELITADSFTRRGRFEIAAQMLRVAVEDRPNDQELWLALAMNLVAHADGKLTPPAGLAFDRAEQAAPGQVAAGFFRGAAGLGTGDLEGAREEWARALANGSPDAWGRAEMEQRLAQLDEIIERSQTMPAGATATPDQR